MKFIELKKNLKKDTTGLTYIKTAILADTPSQLLTQALKGYGYEVGINFDIFEAGFDQIEQEIFNVASRLYQFYPQFIIIFQSAHKLLRHFYELPKEKQLLFADEQIKKINDIYHVITTTSPCSKIIYFNFAEIDDKVFGNYANKTDLSFLYQIRKLNLSLMDISRESSNLFINDISTLQNRYGYKFITDIRDYVNTGTVLSIDALPIVAKNITDIILAASGRFKKCIILDLDNTLWGGIVGDDGIENIQLGQLGIGRAFTELQLWLKQLKRRGIILAVCSKMDESIAKEVFEKHPDMVLSLDDIAVFVTNWNNKADNIRYIQNLLNISFDSMVFIDDSPFERGMVKANIPEITTPEMPEDPAEYVDYLRSLNLFETVSILEDDEDRTRQYKQQAQRIIEQRFFANEQEFLASLNMKSSIKPFDKFTIPRIAQLIQRSNQFNLRTIRYSQEEIYNIAASDDFITLCFTLEDKFGDNGLVSAVILKKLTPKHKFYYLAADMAGVFIDTWVMSCRVLKRGLEAFVMNNIISTARNNNISIIIGEYIPTKKNGIVKDLFPSLGFTRQNGIWVMNIAKYKDKPCFIKAKP